MVFGKNMKNNQDRKGQNARISVSTKAEKFKMATMSLKHFTVKVDESYVIGMLGVLNSGKH